jgi:hypothetical protein
MKLKVVIVVRGEPNYLRWTLERWFEEVKGLVEGEYGVAIDVRVIDGVEEYPVIESCGKTYFEGLPGEEGFLIEVIKRIMGDWLEHGEQCYGDR